MSIKLASTSVVRPATVTEPSSDVAHAYGVRLNVQPGIAGGGGIGALVGMVTSAAIAPPQTPNIIANEVIALIVRRTGGDIYTSRQNFRLPRHLRTNVWDFQ